jgi:hypothetical protein
MPLASYRDSYEVTDALVDQARPLGRRRLAGGNTTT